MSRDVLSAKCSADLYYLLLLYLPYDTITLSRNYVPSLNSNQIKEILPRIGYTSLPILAISSLDNRGIIELKKELATLIMKKEVPATAGSARIEDGRSSGNNEENVTAKKIIRAWKPSDFKVSGET